MSFPFIFRDIFLTGVLQDGILSLKVMDLDFESFTEKHSFDDLESNSTVSSSIEAKRSHANGITLFSTSNAR